MNGIVGLSPLNQKIKQKQAENREAAMRRFEEMPAAERDKIWTQEQKSEKNTRNS